MPMLLEKFIKFTYTVTKRLFEGDYMRRLLSLTMVLVLLCGLASACGAGPDPQEPTTNPVQKEQKLFTDRDFRTEYQNAALIQLQGSGAQADSENVTVSGSVVTVTGEGTYLLSGTLEDGSVIIDAGDRDKLQLVLDGVRIHSTTTAALSIRGADKVFLTLAPGSENSLSSDAVTQQEDAALFSKQDLTVNGSGSMTVTSAAGHGISCKDDLVFTGGSCTVNAASHSLDANDSLRITGDTTLLLNAGKDGIHCQNADDPELGFVHIENGTLTVEAQGDAISAGAYANIQDGSLTLTAGGGSVNGTKESSNQFGGFMGGGRPGQRPARREAVIADDGTSMKGLKAEGDVILSGGTFVIDAADDAIHADGSVSVTGGSFDIKTGDDAFHAEDSLAVSDGQVNIRESYEGLEAHAVTLSGGTLLIHADDDGINAAGGQDESGITGGRDGMFGPGGPGGHFGSGASDGVIEISGGKLAVHASGDGLDANGSITVSGGEVYVANPRSGDTSVLDSDTGAVITGGRFIGVGASMMMAQSFDRSSTQGVLACSVGNQSAGTPLTVTDPQGNTLISLETEYSSVLVLISTPEILKGQSYTLSLGETSGTVAAE